MIKYKLEAIHNVSNSLKSKQVCCKNKHNTNDNNMIVSSENKFKNRLKTRFARLFNVKK